MNNVRRPVSVRVVRWTALRTVLMSLSLSVGCGPSNPMLVAVDGDPTELTITVTGSGAGAQTNAPSRLDLEVGDQADLTATALNALGQPVGSAPVTWGSTDSSVASVASNGQVTAVGAGRAEIFATSSDVFATLPVDVTSAPQPPTPG